MTEDMALSMRKLTEEKPLTLSDVDVQVSNKLHDRPEVTFVEAEKL